MNKPNTQYGLRIPADSEIVSAFGSLAACLRITGGDLPTILFYLANPDRIAGAGEVGHQPSAYAEKFRERALTEAAAEAFAGMEKPTIVGVSREIGVCRSVAKRLLVTAGKVAA
jgi:hypothetical protein